MVEAKDLVVVSQVLLGIMALAQMQLGLLLFYFWCEYNTNHSLVGILWTLLPWNLESACILAVPVTVITTFVQLQRSKDVWKRSIVTWTVCFMLQLVTAFFLGFFAYRRLEFHNSDDQRHKYHHAACAAYTGSNLLEKIDACQNIIFADGAMLCAWIMFLMNIFSALLIVLAGTNQKLFRKSYEFKMEAIMRANKNQRNIEATREANAKKSGSNGIAKPSKRSKASQNRARSQRGQANSKRSKDTSKGSSKKAQRHKKPGH